MNTMKQTIAVMAVALVGLLTVNASYGVHETSIAGVTVVLLSEDFEGYSAGSLVNDAAGWTSDGSLKISAYNADSLAGQRLDEDGNAFDGNSGNEQGGTTRIWSTSRLVVPAPSANALTWTVAFDTIVQRGSNSNGTGNSGLYIECGSDCGEFGFHFQRANNYGWGFINSGDGLANVGQYTGSSANATPPANGIWHAVNSPTTASITLDKTTMTASATVGGYDFDPQAITQGVWDGITGLRVRNDINLASNPQDGNYGIDLDNIVVSQTVPGPSIHEQITDILAGQAALEAKLDNLPAGAQGPAGADGATGADGTAGAAGAAGAQGPQGKAGADGAAGAAAACTPCADVTDAAAELACKLLGTTPPTSVSELQEFAQTIVDTLLISANICEPDCDVDAGITAAIDAKLNP